MITTDEQLIETVNHITTNLGKLLEHLQTYLNVNDRYDAELVEEKIISICETLRHSLRLVHSSVIKDLVEKEGELIHDIEDHIDLILESPKRFRSEWRIVRNTYKVLLQIEEQEITELKKMTKTPSLLGLR